MSRKTSGLGRPLGLDADRDAPGATPPSCALLGLHAPGGIVEANNHAPVEVKSGRPDMSKQSKIIEELQRALDTESIYTIVRSPKSADDVTGFARDEKVSAAIWIGRYVGKRGKRFGLHEVLPDASWDAEPTGYRFSELTAVTIEDHYMTAIAVIAGEPPAPSV